MDILVLNDGIKGNFNQSYGIAGAFPGGNIEIFNVSLKGPAYVLPGRKGSYPAMSKVLALICRLNAWALGKRVLRASLGEGSQIPEREADIIISAGSVLAPVNLILARSSRKARSVQVMLPSWVPLNPFDFLVIPYHDFLRVKRRKPGNIIVTLGAPNRITETFLKEESEKARKVSGIQDTGRMTLGVIIGGDDQNYKISLPFVKKLMDALGVPGNKHNFIFTTSRRTEDRVVSYLRERLPNEKAVAYAEFPGYSRVSCYPGILGLCDCLLVTEDSINMISEAASSGVPVIIMGVGRKTGKKPVFDFTIERFVEKGYAEYVPTGKFNLLQQKIEQAKNLRPVKLNESEKCARKISAGRT